MRTSRTLGEAIAFSMRYSQAIPSTVAFSAELAGDQIRLTYAADDVPADVARVRRPAHDGVDVDDVARAARPPGAADRGRRPRSPSRRTRRRSRTSTGWASTGTPPRPTSPSPPGGCRRRCPGRTTRRTAARPTSAGSSSSGTGRRPALAARARAHLAVHHSLAVTLPQLARRARGLRAQPAPPPGDRGHELPRAARRVAAAGGGRPAAGRDERGGGLGSGWATPSRRRSATRSSAGRAGRRRAGAGRPPRAEPGAGRAAVSGRGRRRRRVLSRRRARARA